MRFFSRLILIVVVWGALAFGAVYPWAYWPLAGACTVLGLWGLRAEAMHAGWLRGFAVCLGLVALVAGMQLVPLPRPWLLALGPSTDAFLSQFDLAYATQPGAHPLSIAPERTLIGLVLFAVFAVFLLGLIRGVPHIRLESAVRRLVVFAVLMAVFGLFQKGFHAGRVDRLVYGFWRPIAGMTNPFGPFLNRNHFAGWMVMALGLASGYAGGMVARHRPPRSGWAGWSRWIAAPEGSQCAVLIAAVLGMGVSVVISGSRSGIASFAVAVSVLAIMARRAGRRRSRHTIGAVIAVLVVVTWAGLDATLQRFSLASDDLRGGRFAAWRDTLNIVNDFPVVGSGLNTYGAAMLVYQTVDPTFRYREAHNDYLQLLSEGGLLMCVPVAAALVIFVRQVRRRFREGRDPPMTRWIRIGAVASLAGIATQSLMDFSLQMPGNAAFFVVIAAIAVHRPMRSYRAEPPPRETQERSW